MLLKLSVFTKLMLIVALVAILLSCVSAHGQTIIQVPLNFPTIQSAINAANNGDTVLVGPGTYVENINFNGKAIIVTSSDGPAATIIDGNHKGTVVTANHSETPASVLSGFTVRNGFQNGGSGAGITISSASPTITNNIVTGNHAAEAIGIYVNGGSPLIQKNTISTNDQTGAGDGGLGGGGIAVAGSSTSACNPQILNNAIINNSVSLGGNGGGISVSYFSSPVIQGNLIRGNSAYNNGGGISLGSYNSPVVMDNLIVGNSSQGGGSGGGLYVSPDVALTVANNTIAGNSAIDGTSGVFVTGLSQYATLANNIIVAASGQSAVTCNTLRSSVSAVFSHNDVYSSTGAAYSGPCDTTSNPGNISADPLFLSAANNDFHLAVASPAVDAGDNSIPNLPPVDLDGNPRIADGNSDGSATIDLGAFEVTPTSSSTITPEQLSFAVVALDSASPAQVASLTAAGATPSQITSVQITGDFAQTTNCPQFLALVSPQSLPSGSSCAFNVTFTPTIPGLRSGMLTVNQSSGTSLTVPLSGTGAPGPLGSLSVSSLAFTEAVGDPSVTKIVTLSNIGNASLSLSSIVTNGAAFSQTNTCGDSLAAGASCVISVTFTASASSTYNGELDILDTPDGLSYAVSLSGVGIDFSINPSTNSLSLAPGSAVQEVIALKSSGGNYPYTVSLSCSGLPSNASCTFGPATAIVGSASILTVSGQSQVTVGTFAVTITGVSGNGITRSAQIQLTVKPSIVLSTSSLTFSAQPVGNASIPSTVTLTNNSTGNFPLSFIGASGPFLLQSNNCPSSLPANSSCAVSVSFAPQTYGPASGSLSIVDNVDSLSYSAALSGTGVDFSVNPSTNSTNLLAGSTVQIPVTVTAQGGVYPNSVALSCTGLPPNTACSFSSATIQSGFSSITSTMTLTSQAFAAGGTSSITIAGVTSFGHVNAAQVQLTILKPSIVLSAPSLNFPIQAVGTTSPGTTLTLINNGAGPFHFTSITASPSFTQSNNCPSVLAVNSGCSVIVAFQPAAYGQASGVLGIQDNIDGLSYSVALGGVGVDFAVSTSPATATVVRGNSAGFTVSVNPLGGSYPSIVALSCSGLPAGSVCAFSPQTALPDSSGSTVNLAIITDQKVIVPGTYSISVVGSSSVTHTSQIQVTVTKNKNN